MQDHTMKGMSPIVPIRRFIDIDNVLARYVQDFFANHAVPPALLIFKNKLNQSEVDRIMTEMKDKYSKPGKYHSLGVSFGDAKLERMGISIKDLDVKPVLDFVETRILQAYNIPPVLIGAQAAMGVSASYSNYREARASFQTENIGPRQKRMVEVLNHGLASRFGLSYEIYFDLSEVKALQEDHAAVKKFALDAWNGGALTLNEFRKMIGLPAITGPEGDQRKVVSLGGAGTSQVGEDEKKKPAVPVNGKVKVLDEAIAS